MIGVMKSSTTWINTPTAFLILCLRLTPLIHAASSKRASDTRSDRKDLTILTQRTVTDDDPHSGTTRQRSLLAFQGRSLIIYNYTVYNVNVNT